MFVTMTCDPGHVILSYTLPCIVSPKKRKEKKRNINNDLAILPSHDILGDNITNSHLLICDYRVIIDAIAASTLFASLLRV